MVRSIDQITRLDRAALEEGNNNLVEAAAIHLGMDVEQLLQVVFKGGWTTTVPPGDRPTRPPRIASDTSVPCGTFKRDVFNISQRS